MNEHALVVWEFLVEATRRCWREATVDAAFTRLVLDMYRAYPDEFDYVLEEKRHEDK